MSDDGWLRYPSGHNGGRTVGGCYVTISDSGSTSISPELSARIPAGHAWLLIDYHAERRQLRLTPLDRVIDGSLKMSLPGRTRHGQQARIQTPSGYKDWQIIPAHATRYPAEWQAGAIMVDLTHTFDGSTVTELPTTEDRRQRTEDRGPRTEDRRQRTDDSNPSSVAANPAPPEPGSECCLNCGYGKQLLGLQQRTCAHPASGHTGKLVSPRYRCDQYRRWRPGEKVPNALPLCGDAVPRSAQSPVPSAPRRGRCSVCGTEHVLTGKGIFPHDVHGVDYRAGRGDAKKRCPGSGSAPGGPQEA